jgi:hypothetical protein
MSRIRVGQLPLCTFKQMLCIHGHLTEWSVTNRFRGNDML